MRSISMPGIGSGSSWRMLPSPCRRTRSESFAVEPSGRARRRDQLLDRHLQRGRHLVEHGERRVAGARLEVAPGRPRQLRELRHLLLREPARLAQLAHVLAEPGRERVAHGKTIAKCQYIGNPVGLLAARPDPAVWRRFAMQLRGSAALVTGREPRARRRAGRGAGAARARAWSPWRARRRRSTPWWPGSARTAARRTRSSPTRATRTRSTRWSARPRRSWGRSTCWCTTPARSGPLPLRELARHRVRGLRARAGGQPARAVPSHEGRRRLDGRARRGARRRPQLRRGRERLSRLGRLRRVEGRRSTTCSGPGPRSSKAPACAS